MTTPPPKYQAYPSVPSVPPFEGPIYTAYNPQQQQHNYSQYSTNNSIINIHQVERPPWQNAFLVKVYTHLTFMIAITTLFSVLVLSNPSLQQFMLRSTFLFWLFLALSIVSIIYTFIVRKKHPQNLIALYIFNFIESFLIGFCVAPYAPEIVLKSFLITTGLFIGLTYYAFTNRNRDFVALGAASYGGLSALIIMGFVMIFFPVSRIVYTVYCAVGVLVFMGFIVIDTVFMLQRLGPDDFVEATISLYVDFVNLFLYILQLIDNKD